HNQADGYKLWRQNSMIEEALESRTRLQTVLDTIPSGIIILEGPEQRVTYMNRHAQEFFQVPPEIGMPLPAYAVANKLMHPDGRPYLVSELPMSRALNKGETVYNDELVIETPSGKRNYLLLSAAPLRDPDGKIVGVVVSTENITPLVEAREALKQAYERERRISETLQKAFFSQIPEETDSLQIVSAYKAALEEAAVGGDFYDVFKPSQHIIAIAIGDVSGKGVEAAVHTALAKYSLRAYAYQDPSPSLVMESLNNAVYHQISKEAFITMFYGIIDLSERIIRFVSAGHEPPMLINDTVEELALTGTAIGIAENEKFEELKINFQSGSLLLYTDGVTEARGKSGFFGRERLKEFALKHKHEDASKFVNLLLEELNTWCEGHLKDDVALLYVKA
ncbi:MAG: SpoIIE family protein phosphatase, partial [Armatimonadota bacterium]|nr:SpoIIE family protein phosphatase [Armatimonadota bacterium]